MMAKNSNTISPEQIGLAGGQKDQKKDLRFKYYTVPKGENGAVQFALDVERGYELDGISDDDKKAIKQHHSQLPSNVPKEFFRNNLESWFKAAYPKANIRDVKFIGRDHRERYMKQEEDIFFQQILTDLRFSVTFTDQFGRGGIPFEYRIPGEVIAYFRLEPNQGFQLENINIENDYNDFLFKTLQNEDHKNDPNKLMQGLNSEVLKKDLLSLKNVLSNKKIQQSNSAGIKQIYAELEALMKPDTTKTPAKVFSRIKRIAKSRRIQLLNNMRKSHFFAHGRNPAINELYRRLESMAKPEELRDIINSIRDENLLATNKPKIGSFIDEDKLTRGCSLAVKLMS